ncbi:MAG: hypothetical protein GQ570_08885 [Helicobacteraceae bacterium]|nr:hypothetical protein [Helicobacteraceae bacterium]
MKLYLSIIILVLLLSGCSLKETILNYQSSYFPLPSTNGIVIDQITKEKVADVLVVSSNNDVNTTDKNGEFTIAKNESKGIKVHPMSAGNYYVTYSFALAKVGYEPRLCVCYSSLVIGCQDVKIELKANENVEAISKKELFNILESSNVLDREHTKYKMEELENGIYCSDGLK